MEENDTLSFKDRTLDELIGHLASDVQGDGQFNHLRFTPSNTPPVSRISPEFSNEIPQNFTPQRNLFFQENYQSHQRGSLPFIFNTREDVLPAMVDVGGGNYVVYETANAQRNQNMPNVHFIKKTNGTLSGFNDYGVEYTGMDYNLFQGVSPQRHSVSQYHQTAENNMKAQLIENLVGNWASDQTGTYSPFGSSLGGVRASDIAENVGIGRGSRKTRIVAEVRPMRPSYSDVLSKSVTNNQKPNNKTSQEVKQKTNDAKIKTLKSSIGRTLSGNGNILNRQHSAVIDDSNLKGNSFKKSNSENKVQEGLSKKWLSLDDLNDATRQDDYININDVKNKKNSPKNINNKGHKKEKWETTQLNNAKNNAGSKSSVPKKPEKINVKLQNNMTKEKENIPGPKPEPIKTKPPTGEERRAPIPSQSKSDQQKSARRNGRPSQPEKHRKSLKGKRKDQDTSLSAMIKNRLDRYGGVLLFALRWLLHLVLDVLGLSINLALHMCAAVWASMMLNTIQFYNKLSHSVKNIEIFQRIINSRFNPFKKAESKKNQSSDSDDESDDSGEPKVKRKIPRGLKHNISLPVTGEEAMKRLLACKGKDPYSILGVTQDCTDDDIKKYYKRQAFLVHPDKNNQPGAEEAFKILVHAFDIIGEPEHRKSYDRTVEKTQVEQAAWSELSDLLSQLHKKMEYVANTIRCTNCNKRHKRTTVDRPIYAARMCGQCKIHHSVREGDIWAETSLFGFLWHYYACMDGAVYDITEWAGCQGSNLRNLKANTHNVQYRIVLGKQPGQKQRYQHPAPTSEPDFEDFLNNLYTKSESGSQGPDADASTSSGGRKRKTKKKK